MNKFKTPIILIDIIIIVIMSLLALYAYADVNLQQQRQLFQQAEQQIKQGYLHHIPPELDSYVLSPYLQYLLVNRQYQQLDPTTVEAFIDTHRHYAFIKPLEKKWLRSLAQNQPDQFIDRYDYGFSKKMDCLYATAAWRSGQRDPQLQQYITSLWLVPYSQHQSCDPLFYEWRMTGFLTQELIWERYTLALSNNNLSLAHYLAKQLNADYYPRSMQWLYIAKYPHQLTEKLPEVTSHHDWFIISLALTRLARSQPQKALALWHRYFSSNSQYPKHYQVETLNAIVTGLMKKNIQSAELIAKQYSGLINDTTIERLLHEEIRQQGWANIIEWIQQLSPEEQANEKWRYWKARSLISLNKNPGKLLQKLAKERHFYGFLASDWLKQPYQLNHKNLNIDPSTLTSVSSMQHLQVALEFHALGKHYFARREWNALLSQLTAQQKAAAAYVAYQAGWYDRAIFTLPKIDQKNDLALRFPLAYRDDVIKASQQHNINPAWAFAIARQESAFIADARSRSGAMGLMQLMPATARDVARKLQLRRFNKQQLNWPEVNVKMGTYYLSHVMDRYDNPILATASYNAGPNRVKRWLPSEPVPADVWIESIPIKETRHYVQRVLTYQVIYASHLGEPDHLMQGMSSSYIYPF